jgi:hypothetical protein
MSAWASVPDVSQSSVIFAFFALAFLVYITMKGELSIYAGFLLSDPKSSVALPDSQKISATDVAATAVKVAAFL